jgi:hypothetical protein
VPLVGTQLLLLLLLLLLAAALVLPPTAMLVVVLVVVLMVVLMVPLMAPTTTTAPAALQPLLLVVPLVPRAVQHYGCLAHPCGYLPAGQHRLQMDDAAQQRLARLTRHAHELVGVVKGLPDSKVVPGAAGCVIGGVQWVLHIQHGPIALPTIPIPAKVLVGGGQVVLVQKSAPVLAGDAHLGCLQLAAIQPAKQEAGWDNAQQQEEM